MGAKKTMSENLIDVLQSVCRATGATPEITRAVLRAAKGEPTTPEKAITTKAAAEALECCPRTVHRLAARGLLTPIRRSRRCLRWRRSEVERLALEGVK
jgi:hypothetical protein